MHHPSDDEQLSLAKVNDWLNADNGRSCSSSSDLPHSKRSSPGRHHPRAAALARTASCPSGGKIAERDQPAPSSKSLDSLVIRDEEHASSESALSSLLTSLSLSWLERTSSGTSLHNKDTKPLPLPATTRAGGLHDWEEKALAASLRARCMGVASDSRRPASYSM
ncbi:hypothetical protein GUITHDRAFT_114822 [Guillardia theta CCMP2712]|uniref:Uncharacterized protein n=1 Tax=Guillardia theta (strain CCMP2712) TaxID=905079 RepID=L1ISB6_GUITC|nr:hypothetical protein GUITHDRAFT_114821 [Guillardia theta CCMP2712]XP_005826146.1 hypothetical protein GUITHDRAFT_114822 [Guillardia theta CCMP2712]EKX39165.1 hypothetical protein GUITHDRAFT_114821 [Guillardia theta CCMP2712]EKX39166.1 hypothetical protein GUITHDRAFT_114822 [Guillardia theta CCMP2712]|eukprot:XP_005826145.1 hypothetical protein GUITHDRAFT_114821 [Guillardia theta CCMP2712]